MASSNASNLDQEHKDLTRLREVESRKFSDTYDRFIERHIEVEQRTRETLLNPKDAGLRPHEPRLQVRITGPPTVSLSSKTLPISARLTYMPSQQDSQPLTLQNGGVTGTGWNEGEAYLFYDEQGRVPEHEFLEKNYDDDEPRLVRLENGLLTVEAGETVEREVEIWLSWWRGGMKLGREYDLRMPWAHVAWWDYGSMDVSVPEGSFRDTQVCCFDTRDDGGFKIPASNVLRVKVVE